MRTTIRIDDDLLKDLRERAYREGLSLTHLINCTIRRGLDAPEPSGRQKGRYREKPVSLGPPHVSLDKASVLAAAMEDEQTLNKLAQRK